MGLLRCRGLGLLGRLLLCLLLGGELFRRLLRSWVFTTLP